MAREVRYPRCKSLGLIEAGELDGIMWVTGEYPRCKSLGLIEAARHTDGHQLLLFHIRGVKASASLKRTR